MSDISGYDYPSSVEFEIDEGDESGYAIAAEKIRSGHFDVLSVQHEYGIFGGSAGSHLLKLLRELKIPIVTTLHTVLSDPSPSQMSVMNELLQISERIVVMSQKAVGLLLRVHGVPSEKIDLIAHGIPMIPRGGGEKLRQKLGITGPFLLTFGLLSPDKGIEHVIRAMPEILRAYPDAVYGVVGATHPHIRATKGEAYRRGLEELVLELGLGQSVRFDNSFVETAALVEYLAAMDIYLTPYLKPTQITSGTLAYALGAGKAVVSTPYWYAEEVLDEGRGVLVPFSDPGAIAQAVISIESDPEAKASMGEKAAAYGAKMLWPSVAKSYLLSFTRAMADHDQRQKPSVGRPLLSPEPIVLPEFRLSHVQAMSDDTGIFQHAIFSMPNRSEGYCVDDNARALILTTQLNNQGLGTPETDRLQAQYLSFLIHAFDPSRGRFRNFMGFNREWLEETGSEDSHGRSLWALGTVVLSGQDRSRREAARTLFDAALPALHSTTSPRTWAYGILALDETSRVFPFDWTMRAMMATLAERLYDLLESNRSTEWVWFEQSLTYCNARLAQALIMAGQTLHQPTLKEAGLEALRWLQGVQTGVDGEFLPIGTDGFYVRGGHRAMFDQQPVEAAASVSACLSARRVTRDDFWRLEATRSFEWYLGQNSLGLALFEAETGACHDGLHRDRMNRNQGAESTLSFLSALLEMQTGQPLQATAAATATSHQ